MPVTACTPLKNNCGMCECHRAPLQVIALTTAIGVLKGTGSEAFAVGLVFSLVVRCRPPCTLPQVVANACRLDTQGMHV